VKLLRTIRLDPSDGFVFPRAAEPGEWAVAGGFMFWDSEPSELSGKERAAFRSGILGIDSFGWSTLAVVAEASEAERDAAIERLAARLIDILGAPDMEAARAAAAEEIAYAEELAVHPVNTLIAVERRAEEEGVTERFRTLHARTPGEGPSTRFGNAFGFVTVDAASAEDEPAEHVDLLGLGGRRGGNRREGGA
jgi:hypothetical protein